MNNKLSFKTIITAGAVAAAVAVAVNVILFYSFHALNIITDDIQIQPGQPMTVFPIIFSSVLPTLLGACIFFLFEKYSKNGMRTFNIIAFVLLLLSFANPFLGIPNVTVAYGIALNLMHVVVALSLLYFLNKAKRSR